MLRHLPFSFYVGVTSLILIAFWAFGFKETFPYIMGLFALAMIMGGIAVLRRR